MPPSSSLPAATLVAVAALSALPAEVPERSLPPAPAPVPAPAPRPSPAPSPALVPGVAISASALEPLSEEPLASRDCRVDTELSHDERRVEVWRCNLCRKKITGCEGPSTSRGRVVCESCSACYPTIYLSIACRARAAHRCGRPGCPRRRRRQKTLG
eukprot:scaffold40517_cov51-Phaeocystis_antarctica.AAC.1